MKKNECDEYIELYNRDLLKSVLDYDDLSISTIFIDFNLICHLISVSDRKYGDDELTSILILMLTDYVRRGGDSYTWYKITAEYFAIALSVMKTKEEFWSAVLDSICYEMFIIKQEKKDTRSNIEIVDEIIEKMKNGEYHNPFIDSEKVTETINRIRLRYYPDRNPNSLKKVLYDRINFRE